MKLGTLIARTKYHLKNGTLTNIALQKLFETSLKGLVNTAPYNAIYSRAIKSKAKKLTSPTWITFETNTTCNSNCIMCPRSSLTRKLAFMDMTVFKTIVDKLAEVKSIKQICLNGFGEPLLDPYIFERVDYIKSKMDVPVMFFTNGSMLKRRAEELLNSKVDEINISFNGTEKEYNKVMRTLDFKETRDGILYFINERKRLGKTTPRVYMSCVYVSPDFDKEQFKKDWEGIVDSIFLMPAERWGDIEQDKDIPFVPQPYKEKSWACRRIWDNMWISCEGNVHLCCHDYDGKYIMGDLRTQSIDEIWNSERFKKIRQMHLDGNFSLPICKGCGALLRNSVLWWG